MRSYFAGKLWIGVISLLGLGALLVLALGMRSMSFHNGQAIGRNEPEVTRVPFVRVLADAVTGVPLQIQLMFIALIMILAVLIGMLLTPEGRKRLFRILFRVAVTYIILYLLLTRYPEVFEQLGLTLQPPGSGAPAPPNTMPPPVFTPPNPSSWLSYLIGFAIAALFAYSAWKIYAIWRELTQPVSEEAKKRIATVARASLRDLSSGRDSTDVILGCYYRMSEAVSHNKNLDRGASMTPAEFAARLETAGLPADAVQRLTRLFEAVRYGGYKSSPKMINEAVACLTTILNYCGEPV